MQEARPLPGGHYYAHEGSKRRPCRPRAVPFPYARRALQPKGARDETRFSGPEQW